MTGISIIIPTYNGRKLLERNLPFLLDACGAYQGETEIIVVDDGGGDDTSSLSGLYPKVTFVRKEQNEGFAKTVNLGVRKASHPLVFLLNNDVEVTHEVFRGLAEPFSCKDVFAVQPKMVSVREDETREVVGEVSTRHGFFYYRYREIVLTGQQSVEMDFCSAGACLVSREKLLQLGLFDERFSPFYFEDMDLSLRAKMAGWRILYFPGAKVYHRHAGSTVKTEYTHFRWNLIHKRNYFLLIFKHAAALGIFPACMATLPLFVIYKTLTGHPFFLLGFAAAVWRTFQARAMRAFK
ncbi:MAG: hypothetical protein A2049_03295 [Elusimicrobia bacterium GWA2_62_23]|nr:MAG: hypothetical protein A2049_03295 [Elusimicrobia bacterium GWA2_62_23]HBB65906.1 hypothetical protein [Elusimicrobiota bacterium]